MVRWPWQRGSAEEADAEATDAEGEEPLVRCEFQDGTLSVFEDRVAIERSSKSKFDDKEIPIAELRDVEYAKRLVISYIQFAQEGVENDEASTLSTPVDENTLHFGRGMRDCAREARDTVLERLAAA